MVGLFLISPLPAYAQDDYGLDTVAGKAELKGLGDSVPKITGRFLGAALSLVGILFFILTIYGGVLWMTSHGNSEQATKGLQTTIAAIIGLIIVLAAYTITNFVFKTVEGGEVTPQPQDQPSSVTRPSGPVAGGQRRCVDGGNIGCRQFRTQRECDSGIFNDVCSWFDTECTYDGQDGRGCAGLSSDQCADHNFCQFQ